MNYRPFSRQRVRQFNLVLDTEQLEHITRFSQYVSLSHVIYPLTMRVLGHHRWFCNLFLVWYGGLNASRGESQAIYNLIEPIPLQVKQRAV